MVLKVFLTGATGYIGGSVLSSLLSNPGKYAVTALVRSQQAADKLKTLNVIPLVSSLDDSQLLTKAAEEADIVINTADADHLGAVKAIVAGLSKAPKPKVFIHTSGTGKEELTIVILIEIILTHNFYHEMKFIIFENWFCFEFLGVLSDDSRGDVVSDFIYSDLDMKSINALPLTQIHKEVDQYIFDNSENIDSIIIAPPTIYGLGTGPFNRHSAQIPRIIKTCAKIEQAATLGKGLNVWNNVHVEDLADFYILVLEKALEGKADIRKNGWYFAENGEHRLSNLVQKIMEVMLKKKLIKTATIRSLTKEEVDKYIGADYAYAIGCNSRCKAERSRALGWSPKRGDVFSHIEEEIDALITDKLM